MTPQTTKARSDHCPLCGTHPEEPNKRSPYASQIEGSIALVQGCKEERKGSNWTGEKHAWETKAVRDQSSLSWWPV